jgi:hypothetical protein
VNRVSAVNQRYEATASVLRDGVSVFVVSDPAGTRLDRCVRQVEMEAQSDGAELWRNLVGALKALRWRLAFRPQPLEFNEQVGIASATIESEAKTLRPGLGARGLALVEEAISASQAVAKLDPPVGTRLLETLLETGPGDCIVVTDGRSSRNEVNSWLGPLGFRVFSPGMLTDAELLVDVAYVIGPPRWLRPSLVTAPPAPEVCFVVPSWAGHATLPTTPLAEYAEGAIRPVVRVFQVGGAASVGDPPDRLEDESLEDFAPPPIWGQWGTDAREPEADEVQAHKVLLSGDFAIWMDEGDRIRTLDPSQPPGERVTYTDVDAVQRGTYLLLRLGVTERAALFDETVRSMGLRGPVVASTQQAWKGALLDRLKRDGRLEVQAQLRRLGVHAAVQVMAWTEPTLARPQKDVDFTSVLEWLGIPNTPTFDHATEFRRARSRAASQIREQLEIAVSEANMEALQQSGHVTIEGAGFADIFATRVLAISPSTRVIARHDARVPFRDRGGRWLE